jgi:hypothetical protein
MTSCIKLFPPRESLVSNIPAGDDNIKKLFLPCISSTVITSAMYAAHGEVIMELKREGAYYWSVKEPRDSEEKTTLFSK